MPHVTILETGCRGCTLCVDTCPVDVFEQEAAANLAKVVCSENCIGCLSCTYVCPSNCIEITDFESLRPFHRIEEHRAFVEKFLQVQTATQTLTDEDFSEAWDDVAARLHALAGAVVECMGRGYRAVGRQAGTAAAIHLPEMYEAASLQAVLQRMQSIFKDAFAFEFEIRDDTINLTFCPCGLCSVVQDAGEKVGEAVLCMLFHEYWVGLLTQYTKTNYKWELPEAGATCKMTLTPR